MKTSVLTSAFILVLSVFGFAQGVGINDTGASPDSTAILDVNSNTKGVLLPRMTTPERLDLKITVGLLVFDTDSSSFYYVDDHLEWRQIANSEKYESSIKILNDSTIILNDGFYIERDGTVMLGDSAVAHDDMRVPASSVKLQGSNKLPEWKAIQNGVYTLFFEPRDDDQIFFITQLPHGYKEGTDLEPHVHWVPTDGKSGDVVWKFEYTWFNVGDVMPSTQILTATTPAEGALKHQIAGFGPIDGTGKKISSILVCRVWREGTNSADTYDSEAGFLEFDFHYQIDTFGSRKPFVK